MMQFIIVFAVWNETWIGDEWLGAGSSASIASSHVDCDWRRPCEAWFDTSVQHCAALVLWKCRNLPGITAVCEF